MANNDLLQLDAENRERALALESFIVEAPAGAGKTELLTQRYLRLLALVNEPEEIVAITFTNKAAAEMANRILTSLQDAADDKPVEMAHKQKTRELANAALKRSESRGWNLLAQPARLRINTIDSLSSLLARQMPLMSRFGAQPAVVEDATVLYEEAASRAIASLEDETANDPVKAALRYFDNDAMRLKNQLAQMLARRDQWLPHAGRHAIEDEAARALRHLIQQDMNAAARVLHEGIQQQLMPVARYAASNLPCEHCLSLLLDWETPLLPRHESLSLWLSVCDFLLTQDGGFRKEGGLNKNHGFPAVDEGRRQKKTLVEIIELIPDAAPLAKLRRLPDLRDMDEERRIVGALARLLQLATAHLITVFREAGEVDFVEVSQRALQALESEGGPTDLALKLDYRIQHLLVDEFQDTSPAQVKLLEKLMAGWEPGDGRTIFCVGDPMQSIYRFRKADVGLFLDVSAKGIGHIPLQRLQLTRNNRSCPAIVDWVNSAFKGIFPARDSVVSGAISYREFAATRENLPGEGVAVQAITLEQGTDAETCAALEAQRIVEIIKQEQAEYPQRSIAVLVRARNHLHALVAEIRRNHRELRFQAVEVEALAGRQSIQDLLALTRALVHRADRVNWLAVLRAPWCGLQLSDLHALAADDHFSTVWQLMQEEERIGRLSEDGRQRLLHVRQILAEAFAHQGRQSIRRWVESTWLKLGGPQCLWEEGDVRDVQGLLDLIDKLEAGGRFDIAALEEGIAGLYAAPDVNAPDSLQFMTIHKSKGLEFDTVILPGLHRQPNRGDQPLILWEEVPIEDLGPQLVAAAWCPRHLRDEGRRTTYDYLQDLECERAANEMTRLLYVAATRTIRRLHLVGVARTNGKGEAKPPSGTFLELLWNSIGGDFQQAAEANLHHAETEVEEEQAFIPKLIRLASLSVPTELQRPGFTGSQTNAYNVETSAEEESGSRLEANTGILAHRYMELIAQDGIDGWPVTRLEQLEPVMQRWLIAQGHSNEEAVMGAERALDALRITLQSDAGRWTLTQRAQGEYEYALARAEGELISTHIMDQTFVENGTRWVIDYKTTRFAETAT
ncbi:MAG TPA: UvrD-helicase domain-containing protein, partial [Methylophilaceae bacterium]|nr:UvrD-helicase domain-containing protein [Methylophilaceae bacterium]